MRASRNQRHSFGGTYNNMDHSIFESISETPNFESRSFVQRRQQLVFSSCCWLDFLVFQTPTHSPPFGNRRFSSGDSLLTSLDRGGYSKGDDNHRNRDPRGGILVTLGDCRETTVQKVMATTATRIETTRGLVPPLLTCDEETMVQK